MNPQQESDSQASHYFINYTKEEEKYYSELFDKLDSEKNEFIISSKLADFMKTSGLNNQILKDIYLKNRHKNIYCVNKEEFFIILRLIAYAQNNMPYTMESLLNDSLRPPLPKFATIKNSNNENKINKNENIFEINKDIENKYKNIFYQIKDTKKDFISEIKVIIYWKGKNYGDKIEKVLEILSPYKQHKFLNLKEFIVSYYLLDIPENIKLPSKLPDNLLNYLERNTNKNNSNIVSNLKENSITANQSYQGSLLNPFVPIIAQTNSSRINQENIENEKKLVEDKINEKIKINEQLNNKNEEINKKMKELYIEIEKLKKEQKNIQIQINNNKKEYNHLIEKQNYYKNILNVRSHNNLNNNKENNKINLEVYNSTKPINQKNKKINYERYNTTTYIPINYKNNFINNN